MAIKLQIRRGVAADWANPSNNPTLLVGEIGLETDTGNFKIGTGALAWNSLPYASVTYPQVSGAGNDLNATAYRAQGRYEVGVSVATNVPSDWAPANDAPGILLVTRIATGSIAQVLFSTKTQKVFCRAWDGATYTTWVALNFVTTSQIVDLAVITAKIDDNAVTNTKLRDSAALSVIGRNANSSGDPADIAATAASGAVLRESGSTIGFGQVATSGIADNAITTAKLADASVSAAKVTSAFAIGRRIDVFTTSGTWVCPANVKTVLVECIGGGGGGGGGQFGPAGSQVGGWGGYGGRGSVLVTVVPGTSYTITVGAGGTGGANNAVGTAGGSSVALGLTATGGTSVTGVGNIRAYGADGTCSWSGVANVTLLDDLRWTLSMWRLGYDLASDVNHNDDSAYTDMRIYRGGGSAAPVAFTSTGSFPPGTGAAGQLGATIAGGGVGGVVSIQYWVVE